jgi:hypothetical protein
MFAPKPPMVPVPPQVWLQGIAEAEFTETEERDSPMVFNYPAEEERMAKVVNKHEPLLLRNHFHNTRMWKHS